MGRATGYYRPLERAQLRAYRLRGLGARCFPGLGLETQAVRRRAAGLTAAVFAATLTRWPAVRAAGSRAAGSRAGAAFFFLASSIDARKADIRSVTAGSSTGGGASIGVPATFCSSSFWN